MNETATILIVIAVGLFGLLFGVLLALLGAMAWTMHKAAAKQKSLNDFAFQILTEQTVKLTAGMDALRKDVVLHMSRMDGDRLHEASLAIQGSSKQLNNSVTTFSKLLFAQAGSNPTAPLAGFPQPQMSEAFGLEDERMDDEYLNSQSGRWAGQGQVGWAGVQQPQQQQRQQVPMQYQTDHYNPGPPPEPRRPFGMPASPMTQWPRAVDPQPTTLPDIEGAMLQDYAPGEVSQSVFDTLATPPHQGDMSQ